MSKHVEKPHVLTFIKKEEVNHWHIIRLLIYVINSREFCNKYEQKREKFNGHTQDKKLKDCEMFRHRMALLGDMEVDGDNQAGWRRAAKATITPPSYTHGLG